MLRIICRILAHNSTISRIEPENLATAMHCHLRPSDATPVIICSNYDAHAEFEVAQPIRCCLKGIFHCWYVMFRCDHDLWPSTKQFSKTESLHAWNVVWYFVKSKKMATVLCCTNVLRVKVVKPRNYRRPFQGLSVTNSCQNAVLQSLMLRMPTSNSVFSLCHMHY